ncbi:thymidine kinase [Clostridium tagluense]|uniref:Thymidine kinase n=1 Tax=Clostridium tagluense TaxID=360422 RepID=A0A401UQG0_9CLOT|nr:thymidine kinase [Clostridium tagluense]GCD11764.1 thymidine kinase [Clostridium tagluense]
MSKLYYRHGCMNSSKTANLLMVAHNYESQGKKVLIFKPSKDTRSKPNIIESRTGMSHDCIDILDTDDLYTYILNYIFEFKEIIKAILVDEAQFLTKKQVLELVDITKELDIPVLCYGLKNSSIKGELFDGSNALLYWAETIEEIKTICSYCDKKATMNLRIGNEKPIYTGDIIKCGDTTDSEEYYIPLCTKHYLNPILKERI